MSSIYDYSGWLVDFIWPLKLGLKEKVYISDISGFI